MVMLTFLINLNLESKVKKDLWLRLKIFGLNMWEKMTHTLVNRYWMIELKIRHNLLRLSQFDILTFNKHHLVLLLLSQFVAIFIICGKLLLYWPIFQAFFTIFPAQKPSHHFVMPHNCFWTTIECFLLFFLLDFMVLLLFYCVWVV